jgi:hypothetical protein
MAKEGSPRECSSRAAPAAWNCATVGSPCRSNLVPAGMTGLGSNQPGGPGRSTPTGSLGEQSRSLLRCQSRMDGAIGAWRWHSRIPPPTSVHEEPGRNALGDAGDRRAGRGARAWIRMPTAPAALGLSLGRDEAGLTESR